MDAVNMTWSAEHPDDYSNCVVGSGQCVEFVQACAGVPRTAEWRRGERVRTITAHPTGLAIATFDADGRYGNHTDGRSHAAILITRQDEGLLVWDQWAGHPVQQRLIRYRAGQGNAVNDGDRYHVIIDAAESEAATITA
jgi:hypothetical protein